MYRIDNSTSADPPAPPPTALGKAEGYFTGGNPSTATAATIVDAEWLNMLQEEGANLVLSAGLTLDKADRTQWTQAIDAKIAGGIGGIPLPYVLKAGDTMTGGLSITAGGLWITEAVGGPSINMSRAAGSAVAITGYTGLIGRWHIVPGDSTAEGGGNAGSNFQIVRLDDAGGYLGTPFQIDRASGTILVEGTIGVGGSVVAAGNVNVGEGMYFATQYLGNSWILVYDPVGRRRNLYWRESPAIGMSYDEITGDTHFVSDGIPTSATIMIVERMGNLQLPFGDAFKLVGGPWATYVSDLRVKKNVTDYASGLAEVRALRPVNYQFNGDGGSIDNGKTYIGLIAQEAQGPMPEMVFEVDNPEPQPGSTARLPGQLGMDHGPLTFALVNSVKELAERIEALEAKP